MINKICHFEINSGSGPRAHPPWAENSDGATNMLILSIETSCDDTSIAVIQANGRKRSCFNILANIVSSQTEIHAPFGGVVPSLAARAHQRNLPIVLEKALSEAKLKNKIDLIAITVGPGLEPSLWAGVGFARSLAFVSRTPIIGVNHIEGHISANFINKIGGNPKFKILNSKKNVEYFPALCLVVSGGHTQLILMKEVGKYKLLGETRDDAAGEAFDKVAKLLGLGYPGGPIVATMAAKIKNQKSKIKNIELPRPMINTKDYDFSFSGLKTAVLYLVKNLGIKKTKNLIPNICVEFQQAVIDVLIKKTLRAVKEYNVKSVFCGGGVMANKELRAQLKTAIQNELPDVVLRIPPSELCTDNAVMTGIAGYYEFLRNGADKINKIKANANMNIN